MAKVFIDMPPFSKKSNGVVCFYELYNFLFNRNLDLYFLPRDVFEIKYNINSIPYDLSKYNFVLSLEGANKDDWLIANDTTSKKHIKLARKIGLKILWWQLAPYNFLGGKVFPQVGEINMPFSSCVDPYANEFFYYQPPIDKYWKYALGLSDNKILKKDSITIYTGKGRVRNLPIEIKNLFKQYNINLISRTYPNKRNGMFKLLLNSVAFITFDEFTQLNLEAASIGVPVFVANKIFPDFVYENFPIKSLGERVTADTEYFLELIEKSKNKQLSKFDINELIQSNQTTFNNIYKVLNQNNSLKVSSEDLKRFTSWTSYLANKNMIHPHINGGQSGGSLFIKQYCSNLIDQKNSILLNNFIFIFEEICRFFHNIKILSVFEFISRKLINLYSDTMFPKVLSSSIRFFKYRVFKNYDYSIFQRNANRWQHKKIGLDQILDDYNERHKFFYDELVSQQDLIKSKKTKYIVFSKKKSNKKKSKSIQRLFDNSFLSFKKTDDLKINYDQFDREN